jgi:hypothetical protein
MIAVTPSLWVGDAVEPFPPGAALAASVEDAVAAIAAGATAVIGTEGWAAMADAVLRELGAPVEHIRYCLDVVARHLPSSNL